MLLRLFPSGQTPVGVNTGSSKIFTTFVICIAIATVRGKRRRLRDVRADLGLQDIFLYTLVVPVFPFALSDKFGVGAADVEIWNSILLGAYSAALLVTALICGILSDHLHARRLILLCNEATLCVATLMLCFATHLAVMVVGRVLQGVAAGVLWVVALAILSDRYGERHVGLAMGYVEFAYTLACLVAPSIGGSLYEKAGYYAVFGLAFGTIAIDFAFRLAFFLDKPMSVWAIKGEEDSGSDSRQESDTPSSQHSVPEVECPYLTPATGPRRDDLEALSGSDPGAPSKELSSATVSTKGTKPRSPILVLLLSSRIWAAIWGSAIVAATTAAFETVLPLFVHEIFGWGSLGGGLIFFPLLLPSLASPPIGNFEFVPNPATQLIWGRELCRQVWSTLDRHLWGRADYSRLGIPSLCDSQYPGAQGPVVRTTCAHWNWRVASIDDPHGRIYQDLCPDGAVGSESVWKEISPRTSLQLGHC